MLSAQCSVLIRCLKEQNKTLKKTPNYGSIILFILRLWFWIGCGYFLSVDDNNDIIIVHIEIEAKTKGTNEKFTWHWATVLLQNHIILLLMMMRHCHPYYDTRLYMVLCIMHLLLVLLSHINENYLLSFDYYCCLVVLLREKTICRTMCVVQVDRKIPEN